MTIDRTGMSFWQEGHNPQDNIDTIERECNIIFFSKYKFLETTNGSLFD